LENLFRKISELKLFESHYGKHFKNYGGGGDKYLHQRS